MLPAVARRRRYRTLLPRVYVHRRRGAAYTAAAVRCTSYPPRSATYNVLAEHLHRHRRRRRRRAAARGSATAAVVRSVRGRQSRRRRNRDAYIKMHFFFSNIHNMCEHILESIFCRKLGLYIIYIHTSYNIILLLSILTV